MTRRQLGIIASALIVAGACAHNVFPPPAPPRGSTPVGASSGRTWDASIEEIANFNAPITQLHRESGYLNTDVVRAENTETDTLAECWRVKGAGRDSLVGPTNAFYNIVVRGDSTRSSVRVNARFTNVTYSNQGPIVIGCVTRGVWERQTEAAIKERAEAAR